MQHPEVPVSPTKPLRLFIDKGVEGAPEAVLGGDQSKSVEVEPIVNRDTLKIVLLVLVYGEVRRGDPKWLQVGWHIPWVSADTRLHLVVSSNYLIVHQRNLMLLGAPQWVKHES